MPLVYDEGHLRRAARACMRRCSAPGADEITWADWRNGAGAKITALSQALRAGAWSPAPLRPLLITNYFGKQFHVYIPAAEDRVVHRAMRNAMEPLLEERAFRDWVSGYRPRRNRITALAHVMAHMEAGRRVVADIDVARASDGASPEEVTGWLADYVTDGTFLALFRSILSGPPEPIAPGTGLAPLLINLRLSRVDARLDGLAVVRFADNYVLLAETPQAAEDAYAHATAALAAEGLAANARKSRIRGCANPEDLFLLEGLGAGIVSDTWVLVPGGRCRYGDNARPVHIASLLWTTTQVTPHHLGKPGADLPVTMVSHEQAAALARELGGRLPRSAEWEWMAAGPARRRYPWGEAGWDSSLANLLPTGTNAPVPVGQFPAGATPEGILDVAGNVWEWTASAAMGGGFVIRGGSYASQPAYARCTFLNAAPAALRSPGVGFRVVRDQ